MGCPDPIMGPAGRLSSGGENVAPAPVGILDATVHIRRSHANGDRELAVNEGAITNDDREVSADDINPCTATWTPDSPHNRCNGPRHHELQLLNGRSTASTVRNRSHAQSLAPDATRQPSCHLGDSLDARASAQTAIASEVRVGGPDGPTVVSGVGGSDTVEPPDNLDDSPAGASDPEGSAAT